MNLKPNAKFEKTRHVKNNDKAKKKVFHEQREVQYNLKEF